MKSETSEQSQVVKELWRARIPVFAVPNGQKRNRREQVQFKLEGGSSGVPDLNIPHPCGGWPGAVVEMKRVREGVVSEAQREWLEHYDSIGWLTIVGEGAIDALEQLAANGYPVRVPTAGERRPEGARRLWKGSAVPGVEG